jgi:hypothetical protein
MQQHVAHVLGIYAHCMRQTQSEVVDQQAGDAQSAVSDCREFAGLMHLLRTGKQADQLPPLSASSSLTSSPPASDTASAAPSATGPPPIVPLDAPYRITFDTNPDDCQNAAINQFCVVTS